MTIHCSQNGRTSSARPPTSNTPTNLSPRLAQTSCSPPLFSPLFVLLPPHILSSSLRPKEHRRSPHKLLLPIPPPSLLSTPPSTIASKLASVPCSCSKSSVRRSTSRSAVQLCASAERANSCSLAKTYAGSAARTGWTAGRLRLLVRRDSSLVVVSLNFSLRADGFLFFLVVLVLVLVRGVRVVRARRGRELGGCGFGSGLGPF